MAGPPGVRRGGHSGGHRPPRGPHQGSGDSNSGPAAPRPLDPTAHSVHAQHGPEVFDHRARPTACDPAGTTGSAASGLPTTNRPAFSLTRKPTSTKSRRSRRHSERDALVLVTPCSRVSRFSRSGGTPEKTSWNCIVPGQFSLRCFAPKRARVLAVKLTSHRRAPSPRLAEWKRFCNYGRPHGAFAGKTPYEVLRERVTGYRGDGSGGGARVWETVGWGARRRSTSTSDASSWRC